MHVYSKKIVKFVEDIKSVIKHVLEREIRLRVRGDRFYSTNEEYSYPIRVVIFNNKNMLGYFNPEFYEMGFHEQLINVSKEQLHNIIRHELAHYITFINFGYAVNPHGAEFKAFCCRLGWSDQVYKATTSLDFIQCDAEENSVLRKVQKLMALAGSTNENEAEQAMIKSQQLLMKHNLDSKYIGNDDEEKIILKRILKQKKTNQKMCTIGRILETFFVTTVYNKSTEFVYLEIIGTATNIEIAEYVAEFLDRELDHLWNHSKKRAGLKGLVAKNSFFAGVAKGYCNKINSLKREYNRDVSQALMVIEKKLVDAQSMIYPKLTTSRSQRQHCGESSALGEQAGQKLNINPALNNSAKNSGASLSYN